MPYTALAGMLILSVCLCLVYAKALPKQPGKVYGPSRMPQKQASPSEYESLFAEYVASIDELATNRKQMRIAGYRSMAEEADRLRAQVDASWPWLLDKIRGECDKGPDGKLHFREQTSPVVPTSDASARAISILLDENALDPWEIVSHIGVGPVLLSNGWQPVLQRIVASSEVGSKSWRGALLALCTGYGFRTLYRAQLERMASEEGDIVALGALLFDTDKATGERVSVNTPENVALVTRLSESRYPPEIRATCARYAAATGNKKLAEAVCTELLSQRYKALDNVDAPIPEEDYLLSKARSVAMTLMFYDIRSEHCFKQIFDLSKLPETETIRESQGLMPKGWVRSDFCPAVRLDLRRVNSLIGEVRDHDSGVRK